MAAAMGEKATSHGRVRALLGRLGDLHQHCFDLAVELIPENLDKHKLHFAHIDTLYAQPTNARFEHVLSTLAELPLYHLEAQGQLLRKTPGVHHEREMPSDEARGFRADLDAVIAAIGESSLPDEWKAALHRAVNRVIEALSARPWDTRLNFEGTFESLMSVCNTPEVITALDAPSDADTAAEDANAPDNAEEREAKTERKEANRRLREKILALFTRFQAWVDTPSFHASLATTTANYSNLLNTFVAIKLLTNS